MNSVRPITSMPDSAIVQQTMQRPTTEVSIARQPQLTDHVAWRYTGPSANRASRAFGWPHILCSFWQSSCGMLHEGKSRQEQEELWMEAQWRPCEHRFLQHRRERVLAQRAIAWRCRTTSNVSASANAGKQWIAGEDNIMRMSTGPLCLMCGWMTAEAGHNHPLLLDRLVVRSKCDGSVVEIADDISHTFFPFPHLGDWKNAQQQ